MGYLEHPLSTRQYSLREKKIVVYTSSGCPKCSSIKRWLKSRCLDFDERNLEDSEVMANLILRDKFILSAPALEVRGAVYTEDQIFDGEGKLNIEILGILEGK